MGCYHETAGYGVIVILGLGHIYGLTPWNLRSPGSGGELEGYEEFMCDV